jgi:hypothetical protein
MIASRVTALDRFTIPRRVLLVLLALATIPVTCAPARAQTAPAADELPFAVGERLSYRVRIAKLGTVGRGTMWVEGPVDVRGVGAYRLRSDIRARLGLVTATDQTESWLDPSRLASLRFQKRERHPLSTHDEAVELYPAERRWERADAGGRSLTDAPLDELSFMYFLRTIPLAAKATYRFDRHYEPARNPTTIHVLRRERLETGAGTFNTVLIEMRVKDARRYRGEGIIRINFTDDARRIPVRIESAMPVFGTAVLLLEEHSGRPVQSVAAD